MEDLTLACLIIDILRMYGPMHTRQICCILNRRPYYFCQEVRCKYWYRNNGEYYPDCKFKPSWIMRVLKKLEKENKVKRCEVILYDPKSTWKKDHFVIWVLNEPL